MKKALFLLKTVIFCLFVSGSFAVPITYTVDNAAGGSSGTFNAGTGIGNGTFEHALATLNASADPGPHTVSFTVTSITVGWLGGNVNLTKGNVTFNGGFTACDPRVTIDFTGQNFNVTGVTNVTLRGINFQGSCVSFTNGGSHKIYGCWFNLNPAGTAGAGYAQQWHVKVTNSPGCIIGRTTDCTYRNVFSGAGMAGQAPWGPTIFISGSDNCVVAGNYVGLGKNGTTVLSNVINDAGVGISGSQNARIDSNTVAGFTSANIFATGTITGLLVRRNNVGVNYTGAITATDYGSKYPGIFIDAASGNNIILTENIVCDNGNNNNGGETDCGILVKGTAITGIDINNNYVGVDKNFTKRGNSFAGIYVLNGVTNCNIQQNYVGDNGNGHATNKSHGIATKSITTGPVTIYGNYVGITPGGVDIGNWANGIEINQTNNFTIGGVNANQPNFISYNKGSNASGSAANAGGILITVNSNTGYIVGNSITYNQNAGAGKSANHGIVVENGANRIMIGGASEAQKNTIAYNGTDGIFVGGTASADYVHVRKNSIYCNNGSAGEGIQLNTGPQVGNANHPAPNIVPAQTAPTAGYLNTVTGTSTANDSIFIYTTSSCTATCPKQGESLLAKVRANASGNWSYVHGSTIFNKISAYAVSTSACNSGFCRTSEFSTCIDNPLPAELTNFQAHLMENGLVAVTWQTASEKNNAYFIVEKSIDGKDFYPIGKINGNGTTQAISNYAFTDEEAFSGKAYYRLVQYDLDGKSTRSVIISLNATGDKTLTLFPNPAEDETLLQLTGISASMIEIILTNSLGVEILRDTQEHAGAIFTRNISAGSLASGVYYVTVKTGDESFTEKLIRK